MASLEKKCEEVWAKLDITDKDVDNMGELLYKASKDLGYVDLTMDFLLALGGKKALKDKKLKSDIEKIYVGLAGVNILFYTLGALEYTLGSYKQAAGRCAELKKEYDKLKADPSAGMFNPNVNEILIGYVTLSYLTEKVEKEAKCSKKCKIIRKGAYMPANPPKNPIPPRDRK